MGHRSNVETFKLYLPDISKPQYTGGSPLRRQLFVDTTHNMSPDFTSTSVINPYSVGGTLCLTNVDIHNIESHGNTLNVRIEHVFLPFTKSQTMRVRVLHPSAGRSPDIPEMAVLKLYDRRWIDDRKFDDEPWSPAREEAARARWKAIASGELVDDFDTLNPDDYTQSHEEEQYRRMCKVSLI